MTQQVSNTHYEFDRYASPERFSSYWYQLKEIFDADPVSVVEIGAGDGVVGDYLRRQGAITYTSVDYAADVQPDVVADVRKLPFKDGEFDVACAFEVLEHLPFEDFDAALSELMRVSKKRAIISLPHFGPPLKFVFKIPLLPEIRAVYKVPMPKEHVFNGQHYWEIGKKGYPPSRIRQAILSHGALLRDYVPFENQYHHFFVCKKL
jgi:SAM-dependent methyltransferase